MFQTPALAGGQEELASRAERTLGIMHRWGYAPTLGDLAAHLLGGAVSAEALLAGLAASPRISLEDGFVYLRPHAALVARSRERTASHRVLNGDAYAIARDFTGDLVATCPFIECVALCGSLASGGYGPGDDIDFDLFVKPGTRYLCYLMATLVGARYAWRHRRRPIDRLHRTPLLPKVVCVNVVWSRDQTRPFVRQDEDMAFELLRCCPLFGGGRFREVLDDNPWLWRFFPQLYTRPVAEGLRSGPNGVGRLLASLDRPMPLRVLEVVSRALVWMLYTFVQWSRRGDPEAVARMAFLRRVKWPYEVFQD